jgi:quercetin dioxygenase-like cupin family protein
MQDKAATKTPGAVKAGVEGHLFELTKMAGIEAGTGYSTAHGPVVEGDRIQVGLIFKPRGTGARLHSHPNEQWNYVLSGKMKVRMEGEEDRIAGPGTVVYLPANKVHATIATTDGDLVFLAIKDMSHGIVGMAADGTMSGPHYEPGISPGKEDGEK